MTSFSFDEFWICVVSTGISENSDVFFLLDDQLLLLKSLNDPLVVSEPLLVSPTDCGDWSLEEELADEFADKLQETLGHRKISAAALQHYFVTHRRADVSQVMNDLLQVCQQHDDTQARQRDEAKETMVNVESKL